MRVNWRSNLWSTEPTRSVPFPELSQGTRVFIAVVSETLA